MTLKSLLNSLGPHTRARLKRLYYRAGLVARASRGTRELLSANARFANAERGKTCFVLATAPSLAKQDVSLLAGRDVIAVNELFSYLPERGVIPKSVVIHDSAYFNDQAGNVGFLSDLSAAAERHGWTTVCSIAGAAAIRKRGLFPSRRPAFLAEAGELLGFRDAGIVPRLDFSSPLPGLYTVTHAAVAWAIYLGFSEINILGVDLNFADDADAPLERCYGESRYNDHHRISAREAFERDLGMSMAQIRRHVAMQIEAFEFLYEIAATRGQRLIDVTLHRRLGRLPKRELAHAISNSSFKHGN